MRNFDEQKVLRAFQRHQMFPLVCNAFLVVAAAKEADLPELPRMARFSNDRTKTLAIQTLVMHDRVIKKPDSPMVRGHLNRMADMGDILERQYQGGKLRAVSSNFDHGMLVYRYVEGEGLERRFKEYYKQKDAEAFFALLRTYISEIRSCHNNGYFCVSPEFEHVFGKVNLPGDLRSGTCNNVDLIFDNIVVDSRGKWNVIDYEWSFCFPIPVEFILFRAILDFFRYLCEEDQGKEWKKQAMEEAGISDALYEQMMVMARQFQRYVASNYLPLKRLPLVR